LALQTFLGSSKFTGINLIISVFPGLSAGFIALKMRGKLKAITKKAEARIVAEQFFYFQAF